MPNRRVDMSSWRRSACYPRSTFYPLSDGQSTQNHRITIPYFRTWSTCRSHSQAPLCYCTLRTVTIRTEGTLGSLRYSFGGDRPSQTARLTVSPDPIQGRRLGNQQSKSGIPPVTPHDLTAMLPSLPPILYMNYRFPVLNCSKAPWGLSV